MKLSNEQLMIIEDDAFIAMTPSEIARHIEVPVEDFKAELSKKDSLIAHSYRTGQVKAIRLAKEQIKEQAKVGSPVGLEQFLQNLNDMIADEN